MRFVIFITTYFPIDITLSYEKTLVIYLHNLQNSAEDNGHHESMVVDGINGNARLLQMPTVDETKTKDASALVDPVNIKTCNASVQCSELQVRIKIFWSYYSLLWISN